MPRRNPDGTFRNNNRPFRVSNSTLIARWIEAEALRLKQLGLPFAAIARQITAVGRGEQLPMTPLPRGVIFPTGYKLSIAACHKAFQRGLNREPRLAVDKLRRLQTQRCEEMLLALQPAIQKGDPKSIVSAVRVLEHQAGINGLKSTQISNFPIVEPAEKPKPLPAGFENMLAAAVGIMIEHGCMPPGYTILPATPAIETTAVTLTGTQPLTEHSQRNESLSTRQGEDETRGKEVKNK